MSWTCGNYFIRDCYVDYEDRDGRQFLVLDDDCMKFHSEMCQENLPDLCRRKCYRMGRRGSSEVENCEHSCVDHFKKFEFKDMGRKRLEYPQCTEALQECVGNNGVVDEECVKEYEWSRGTFDDHCRLACIRTPGPECQQQCWTHSKGFIPPLILPGLPGGPTRMSSVSGGCLGELAHLFCILLWLFIKSNQVCFFLAVKWTGVLHAESGSMARASKCSSARCRTVPNWFRVTITDSKAVRKRLKISRMVSRWSRFQTAAGQPQSARVACLWSERCCKLLACVPPHCPTVAWQPVRPTESCASGIWTPRSVAVRAAKWQTRVWFARLHGASVGFGDLLVLVGHISRERFGVVA